jgi:phosphoribosylformimino-5-aminoimidazole carboxamide ribotide isomerase
VIPAIDLMSGQAVRLAEGDPERRTVYSDDPVTLAGTFCDHGAKRIHVVDLDGAFAGAPVQLDLVRSIATEVQRRGHEIQVGGGVRDGSSAETLLDLGVDAVVLGTMAVRDPETAEALCKAHPGRIVIAIDARDGMVAVAGWQEASSVPAGDLARRAAAWGASALLFTDVARDGLQVGAAVEATLDVQREVEIPVIASGGVGSLEDLVALRDAGARAVVVGRALYEGKFTVKEAMTC